MESHDLLRKEDIDPQQVLVLRHRPPEPEVNKRLRWLAAEKPDVFNAYQQSQRERVEGEEESRICRLIHTARTREALFVGLYSVSAFVGVKPKWFEIALTWEQLRRHAPPLGLNDN